MPVGRRGAFLILPLDLRSDLLRRGATGGVWAKSPESLDTGVFKSAELTGVNLFDVLIELRTGCRPGLSNGGEAGDFAVGDATMFRGD